MKIERASAIPLITCDPFFSVWSAYDKAYDGDTTHWCKAKSSIKGYIKIDDETYCFLGDSDFYKTIEQKYIDVSALSTEYGFENDKISLTVKFTTPLLLDDPYLTSRPITYIDFAVDKKTNCQVDVIFKAESDMVQNDDGMVHGLVGKTEKLDYCMMGKIDQRPLSESGDRVKINWGYLYIASADGKAEFDEQNQCLVSNITPNSAGKCGLIIAYDDLQSINYMGEVLKGMWVNKYGNIVNAIAIAYDEHDELMDRCEVFDDEIQAKAISSGGEDYAFLCNMSYRQSISAHKIVETSKGEMLVLSKENDSNGCIGTADVSYPSLPIFMLFGTEYIKGLVRPIMDFADCDVWEYDYAPHDVGRYPYAWGQVYALKNKRPDKHQTIKGGNIFPPTYLFPKGVDVYDERFQMPVEECGNMIIMTAVVCVLEKSAEFAKKYMHHLEQWCEYLIKYGANPGDQLCTDDFAGHLANNINLSLKAIMGIEAYAIIHQLNGNDSDYNKYHSLAVDMAKDCEKRAIEGDHTNLTYGGEGSWGLKYNIIWDKLFGTKLFSANITENEVDYYINKCNEYGVPLDSRADYTKSDWILWCAGLTDDISKRKALITPVAKFLTESSTRVAFGDWYNTKSGNYVNFIARSVQGGIFMPMYADKDK